MEAIISTTTLRIFSLQSKAVVDYYKGLIDDIRIFHRGVSEVEIDSLYLEGDWHYQF